MKGEKIYEYDPKVTGVTDYGVTLQSILSGQSRVPPQGARIDVAFEGRATGRVSGVDYLRIRTDGRIDLDIRAIVETEDGHRIALSADGVGVPRVAESIADLRENVSLSTAAENYAWVNARQIWGGWNRELCRWQDSHRRIHAVTVRANGIMPKLEGCIAAKPVMEKSARFRTPTAKPMS